MLADLPEVRALLDDLQHGRPLGSLPPNAGAALAQLQRAGLVGPPPPTQPTPAPSVVLSGPRALTDAASVRLRDSGVRIATEEPQGTVHLLLAHGALRRDLTDRLLREGTAHLIAVATAWGWELGPFVVPGQTACLRCADAARSERDPRYGLVLDQLARAAVAPVLNPAVLAIGLGWVARDLLAHARGEQPSTWSATVRLSDAAADAPLTEQRWLRHPHCGCAWDALAG